MSQNTNSQNQRVTIARGDGIGPEIMDACINILEAAECGLGFDEIKIGEQVYLKGQTSGIESSSWDSLEKNKVFLKAPITTPQGGGYKSLNVTIRKTLGLFANIRPTRAFAPFVNTKNPFMNLVIVRENEEDLYSGIEHRQTNEVYQCLKLISQPGSERIIRYAFEFTKSTGRKKLTCMSKDNIMKMTDGLFHKLFDEIGKDYPEIEQEHYIIDIGSARLADTPEQFDVVVTTNLYGDIISDITAQVSGSVGLGGSANIGMNCAMFEAIHGSAPDIAGKNIANPSGLIHGSLLMLIHMGLNEKMALIENAWLKTIEDGIHTGDIYRKEHSRKQVGTKEFAQAVIDRLGETPQELKPAKLVEGSGVEMKKVVARKMTQDKKLCGVDVFVHEDDRNAETLSSRLREAQKESGLELKLITNRGVKVWPEGHPETFCTDHWRCRFYFSEGAEKQANKIWGLLRAFTDSKIDVIKIENLYEFDGERSFSLAQGE